MYRLENVRKVFGGSLVAVDDVSLKVGPGERVAIIGPSGAGKTTLFRILNLTVRPTGGRLWVDGIEAGGLRGRALRGLRRKIGTIYQQQNLVPRLRVVHNVLAGRLGFWSAFQALASLVSPRDAGLARAALAKVGIPEKLWARTDELSGGQQQRVAIARALVQNPQVLLADEPVSSVDPSLAHTLVRLLVDISRETGKTLLMNLHSVDLALAYFPRVIGFREGRVLFDTTPDLVDEAVLADLYAGGRAAVEEPEADYVAARPIAACRPLVRPS